MRKFLLLCTMVLAYMSVYAKIYVVIAGVSDYPGSDMDLLFQDNDARVMRDLYKKNGNSRIITLTDSIATTRSVLANLSAEFSKATANDAIVFYFSGHGYPGGFWCYDGYITYPQIIDIMKKSKAKNRILFADACYSGKARYTPERVDKKHDYNIMFFLSSRTKETSLQFRSMKNSLFTTYLNLGMRGKADANRDSLISARELFDYVHTNLSARSNNQFYQHPVMWGNFDDNMIVMDWRRKKKK